jgi:hypothetical protein
MGLRPTHRDENRFKRAGLGSNWRGTAKTGGTLDELRPLESSSIKLPDPTVKEVIFDGVLSSRVA